MSSLLLALHLKHHGPPIDYAGLGLAATAEWVAVPGVGEAALIAAGVLAASGRLDLGEVLAVAFVGATAGGVLGWLLGLKLGHSVFGGPGPLRRTRLRVLGAGERFWVRLSICVSPQPALPGPRFAFAVRMASASCLTMNV